VPRDWQICTDNVSEFILVCPKMSRDANYHTTLSASDALRALATETKDTLRSLANELKWRHLTTIDAVLKETF